MKLFKSMVCLVLALIMAFSCCSMAFAAETEKDYDHLPQVL